MRVGLGFLVLLACARIAGGAARAETITLQSAAPVVVATVPVSGQADVDAGTGEIRATFSKPMQDGNWSWVTVSPETAPRVVGSARLLADQRTAVLPVKLEPGQVYVLWLNRGTMMNFRDTDGHQAVPYLLVFETRR